MDQGTAVACGLIRTVTRGLIMGVCVKACRYGRMMFYASDFFIGRGLDICGEYSESECALWRQIIKPGWTAVDVGANIGAHTLFLSRQVGRDGRVFAIEPQRQLYQMLIGNLALNEIANANAMLGALGAASGAIQVPVPDYGKLGNFGGVALDAGGEESVPLMTLDGLALPSVQFIKIDVEGMEGAVIRGGLETIARCRPVLYVENDRKAGSAALIELLLEMDYRLFWHLAPLANQDNFSGAPVRDFVGVCSVNMLGIHAALAPNIRGLREIASPQDESGVALGHH